MRFSPIQLLSLAGLAASHPSNLEKADGIPYGAFLVPSSSSLAATPSPSTSASASAAATPTPTPTTSPNTYLGSAIIENHCSVPVYVWSVGTVPRSPVTVASGSRYSETYRQDHESGGIALKISTQEDGLYNSAPLTVFAYNLNGQSVWYDLSDVFGDPFQGHPVELSPAEPPIFWADGVPPSGSQVRVRDATQDLVLDLC